MAKTYGAAGVSSDAHSPRRSDWRAALIVAPLLATSLAANALFGVVVAPQVAGFLGHATPASHSVLAIDPAPNNLGGPNVP